MDATKDTVKNEYDDIEDFEEEVYQEVEGDCVEEEYFEEGDETYDEIYEDQVDDQLEIHRDETDVVFSQESQEHEDEATEPVDDEEDVEEKEMDEVEVKQDAEEETAAHIEIKEEDDGKEDIKSEEEDEEEKLTVDEKRAEFLILDNLQRQIEEERYTLRKLRSIIGHMSEAIEEQRKKIATYTRDAQDAQAAEGMEKLRVLKMERERAVEERRISTDALADVRAKREDKIEELRSKYNVKVNRDVTYLIKDEELKALFLLIKRTLLKYNSFAVLSYSMEELAEVIFNVANVCDDIDDFLTTKNARPRDINKLNTKERRMSVLYDKLKKWQLYKGRNPDIRPTDYESFLYDPDDMFSDFDDDEEESSGGKHDRGSRHSRSREMRAVRGGSPSRKKISERSPIRPPTPSAEETKPAEKTSRAPDKTARAPPVRRAVRGGSDTEDVVEKPHVRNRSLRAERGGEREFDSGPRRSPIRKRRPPPLEREAYKRPAHSRHSPIGRSPPGARRPDPTRRSPIRRERDYNRNRPVSRTESPRRPVLLNTPPSKPRRRSNSFEERNRSRGRDMSPGYKSRDRENFQISVKNEDYRNDRRSSPPRRSRGGAFQRRGGHRYSDNRNFNKSGPPHRRTDPDRRPRGGRGSYRR